MTQKEIIAKINEVLAEEFEANIEDITPDAPLMECLDLDSLDLVDVVVLINTNFGITLIGSDFVGIGTFEQFYQLIITKLQEKSGSTIEP